MKKKYRIVTDRFAGFEVQVWGRWWWFPFWRQVGFTNTHGTIEEAKRFIEKEKQKGGVGEGRAGATDTR